MRKDIRVQRLQNKNKMVGQAFNPSGIEDKTIRRKNILLPGSYYIFDENSNFNSEDDMIKARKEYEKRYNDETERLLKIYPNMKLI
jgi:hypothetical protein